MKHFDNGQWADLVRGVACEPDRVAMEAHLTAGCNKCQRTLDILREVAAVASAEVRYQAPPGAVNYAKAIFALQRPERVCLSTRLVARLVYDSFKEPLPAGLRARHKLTRHALYEAADYSLDMRLEHQMGKAGVHLVGQIANRKEPGKPLADLPVLLMSGKEIIARALSNSFGEFQLEYLPRAQLRLFVQPNPHAGKRIEVQLGRLSGEEAEGKTRQHRSRHGRH